MRECGTIATMVRSLQSIGMVLGALLVLVACGAEDINNGGGGAFDGGADIDAAGACQGCIGLSGECLPGDSILDCGGGGNACATCEQGDQCIDQQCETPPSCNADNCDGCCQPDATCVEVGDQTGNECGSGGLACTSCDSGICDLGTCVEACDETTCAGCCAGPTIDDCLEIGNAQSQEACGLGGAACEDCGTGITCTQGTCVDASCSADCPDGCCDGITCRDGDSNDECGTGGEACFSCGADQTCSSGVCVVDPDSLWNFVVVSFDVPTVDGDGDAWDGGGGAPDVYIDVTLGVNTAEPATGTTTTIDNQFTQQLNPPNGETVITNVPASKILDSIELDVNDEDAFNDDDMIVIIDNSPPEALFGGGLFQLATGGFTIRFRVVKP